ncbi:hypothetical protein RZN05_11920 [Sphingomonas sp. HF-S4]|uniref:PD(D/E)XK endonuclease domain-containing protein n=1 Tax=Sphingomonas agrestis TaxID=3080540 RepID=A0ABU3Y8G1_9SPHN|nr:hypothetical protein [Sphingomonas sp. HF-S4]MDV3457695.1 hypothetical protein [Sphingomonas sp. HF-S4]
MTMTRNEAEWAAVFLAAGELTRRGYSVSLTLGPNAPLADLVVRAPSGEAFIVDVKGKCKPGAWMVKPKSPTPGLFYMLVRLGMTSAGIDRAADRFYIMPQTEALRLTRTNVKHPALSGFTSAAASGSLDDWSCLPN